MMNLKETITQINENISQKIRKLIDERGLLTAIRTLGGIGRLKEYLGETNFLRNEMLTFIKDVTREYGGVSVHDLNEDPIFYGRANGETKEIYYFGLRNVAVKVWNEDDWGDDGEFSVRYENLNDDILEEIFEMIYENIDEIKLL